MVNNSTTVDLLVVGVPALSKRQDLSLHRGRETCERASHVAYVLFSWSWGGNGEHVLRVTCLHRKSTNALGRETHRTQVE